jgi:ubiquinone/menaquinone biosynthesis C-methylase UbiE
MGRNPGHARPVRKTVIDLGCGYGWFCRLPTLLVQRKSLASTCPEKMLARARELTDDAGISYRLDDLEQLALPAQTFDLVYSSPTLHYLPDLARCCRHPPRCSRADGWCSPPNTRFTCLTRQAWLTDDEGQRSWPSTIIKTKARVSATGWPTAYVPPT